MGLAFTRQTGMMLLFMSLPGPVLAGNFLDWWLTPDQQGRFYFQRDDFQRAARAFEQIDWKAAAYYHAGDFANAAAYYAKVDTPAGFFNLGNSFAKQEKLALAIEAYKAALAAQPDFPEAAFNLDWVEGLLELDEKEYDAGKGTEGKLLADRTVFDERGGKGEDEVTTQEFQAVNGLTDQQIQDMWMRRVQTTPGDFLALKFSYQVSGRDPDTEEASK